MYVVFLLGFYSGACNYCSTTMALKYYPPLVMTTALLSCPCVSQILGIVLGMDNYPGVFTYLGGFVSLFGIYFVIKGGKAKQLEKEA